MILFFKFIRFICKKSSLFTFYSGNAAYEFP